MELEDVPIGHSLVASSMEVCLQVATRVTSPQVNQLLLRFADIVGLWFPMPELRRQQVSDVGY